MKQKNKTGSISYISSLDKISSPGEIVLLIGKQDDLKLLQNIEISPEIQIYIENILQKDQSQAHTFFIGSKKCQKLHILCEKEANYTEACLFLGKNLPVYGNSLLLLASDEKIELLFEMALLSRYSFDTYVQEKKVKTLEVFVSSEKIQKLLEKKGKTIQNIFLARDLGNTPANDLTPEIFAKLIQENPWKKVKVQVIEGKDIEKKKLGLLHAVGKGSVHSPKLIILEYITDKKKPITAIVGKGVTFDTGGNQIKPHDGMGAMKGDMGGAAIAFSLMKDIEEKKLNLNLVIGIVLAENVVSGNSYKPSDIYTGYNGKTVEIIHTDAEGRLILADGVSYISKNYKPQKMITIATLTGACIVALGHRYAGIMGTDDDLIEKILEYSKKNTEKYVRLPFDSYFLEKNRGTVSDLKNLDRSVQAGSSMGAAFIYHFLMNHEKYTHIDIAGTYINEGEAYGKMPKGMTGFGVESLSEIFEFLQND